MNHNDYNIEDIVLKGERARQKAPFFISKTANQRINEAKNTPIPKMLFGPLWHEGELCFLFADTNLGKSILAVQIADAISRAQSDSVFRIEAERQKVLYFDFELSSKQFENRYSDNYKNHYIFDENFICPEMNMNYNGNGNFENQLYKAIEKEIKIHRAKIIIIDNITYLKTQSTDTAKEALPLMNTLITLKRKYGLSILALAHTPKRNPFNPITINDLAGSKHLANFADSVFAIGASYNRQGARYIKQIKARATEIVFDSDYVIICDLEKDVNFLRFSHVCCEPEFLHLKQLSDDERNELENAIIALYQEKPTLSYHEIARQLGTNGMKVTRVLKRNHLKE